MWNKSLDMLSDRLYDHFKSIDKYCSIEELLNLPNTLRRVLENSFEKVDINEIDKIIQLCWAIYLKENNFEKFEIITTSPNEYKIMNRKISFILNEIIDSSTESILITGYSISNFSDELLNKIVDKSRQGIRVSFYVNNLNKHKKVLEKLILFKSRFLEIYDFKDEEDIMRALHAKVILVDGRKGIISSSNLSYHGMVHNIEMGIAFDSIDKGNKIVDFFNILTKKHVITRI